MKQGIDSAVLLAKAVDNMGYKRIWFAEHHNHDAYASAATVSIQWKAYFLEIRDKAFQ